MIDHRFLLFPLLAATLYGCAFGSQGGWSSGAGSNVGAGSFTLAPGESRTIMVSNTYRTIRICNDVGSSGILEGAVGDYPAVSMAPGVCNANMAYTSDHITVHNVSTGTVSGLYQSSGGKPLGRGGR
jgi:hypothetical protein